MKEILSVANPLVKEWMLLHQKKEREEKQQFLVEGYHLVEEAKKANLLCDVLILRVDQAIPQVNNILVSPLVLTKLTKTKTPQPIVGICNMPIYHQLEGNTFLLLDDIQDPGNMGTLFRSALGFGIDMVVVSPNCVDLFNEKVIRATQGAIFIQKWIKMDIKDAIISLKNNGVVVYGTALRDAQFLSTINPANQYALLLGNEGNGVHPQHLNLCDNKVQIRTSKQLESLNVGVAGSILMYYFSKK